MKQSKIAVTGGIGSGKSTVLALLEKHGYRTVSCDGIYAQLCTEQPFLAGLARLFPTAVKNGTLDRAALSHIVFSDKEAREKLDSYTHPLIMERLLARMEGVCFAEVPLLFEGGYERLFDGTIAVLRDKRARIEAVKRRSGLSEEEIALRMDSQFGYERLPEGCRILRNDGTVEDLERALLELLPTL